MTEPETGPVEAAVPGEPAERGEPASAGESAASAEAGAPAAPDEPAAPGVLFVCTGNLCRSPLAAAILRVRLEEAGLAADVTSVGTAAPIGLSPDRKQRRIAQDLGVDLNGHRAMPLMPQHLVGVDLVLTMTAEHAAAVLELDPSAGDRTVTLRAAAWKSKMLRGGPFEFAEWVRRLTADVPVAERPRTDPTNDLPDPVGGPWREYRAVGEEVDTLVATLVEHWSGR